MEWRMLFSDGNASESCKEFYFWGTALATWAPLQSQHRTLDIVWICTAPRGARALVVSLHVRAKRIHVPEHEVILASSDKESTVIAKLDSMDLLKHPTSPHSDNPIC
jgi:hypothetical protein